MRKAILHHYETSPLKVILIVALMVRLVASIFSEGYAFHDDHFDVTRVAHHWSLGIPHWLEAENPPKHSMVYAGIVAAFMWVLQSLSIEDPIAKTTIIRVFHSFYSLLVILFAYKITLRLSTQRNAILVGWLLALLWFMPYLSVRFLAELVCVPPVLAAFYMIVKGKGLFTPKNSHYWWSGLLLGIAFSLRMHTIFFAGALGLVMLLDKKWQQAIIFTLGYLVAASVLIGIPDMVFFDYPFHYVVGYFKYNSTNAYNYISGSPFKFLLTTIGFLVPPISLFLIWGFIRKGYRISLQIFLAVAIFFVFHSAFPNQQERFILPMYPLLIIVGVIGWNLIKDGSPFWNRNRKFYRFIWSLFWVVNIAAALGLALTFTKKDRILPLYYLYLKDDVNSVIIEGASIKQVPDYYLGGLAFDYKEYKKDFMGLGSFKKNQGYLDPEVNFIFTWDSDKTAQQLLAEMDEVQKRPNYLILKGGTDVGDRLLKVKGSLFPDKKFKLEKTIYPSNYDRLLHFLNPRIHKNSASYIYKLE